MCLLALVPFFLLAWELIWGKIIFFCQNDVIFHVVITVTFTRLYEKFDFIQKVLASFL